MPRRRRMYLRHVPCHVVQRGNNRQPTFFALEDRLYYLDCLAEACARHAVAVHAYVLMTNHVHLLMTPREAPEGISRVMQSLGRRYVQHVNARHGRTGTLWESRHKAGLVEGDAHLLACSRYIEANPVRARMVEAPGDYPWSSYPANAHGAPTRCPVVPHAAYLGLASGPDACRSAYRELFTADCRGDQTGAIRAALAMSLPYGSESFRAHVEKSLGRGLGQPYRGRPRSSAGKNVTDPI